MKRGILEAPIHNHLGVTDLLYYGTGGNEHRVHNCETSAAFSKWQYLMPKEVERSISPDIP